MLLRRGKLKPEKVLEKDIKRLKKSNEKLRKELQAAELYDQIRGIELPVGEARKNYTNGIIAKNNEEISRLQTEIDEIRSKASFWTKVNRYPIVLFPSLLCIM